jgi:hypothetical protein
MTRKALESGELRRARIAGPVLDSAGGIWRPKTISMEPTVKVCDYKSSNMFKRQDFHNSHWEHLEELNGV